MKGIVLLAAITGCLLWRPAIAQQKTLDTAAYKEWRRLNTPAISYDGAWVIYSYFNESAPVKYLVNTQTGREIRLTDVSTTDFFDYGKWLKYKVKDSIILLRLKDGKKIYWDKTNYLITREAAAHVTYNYRINGVSRTVIWNIDSGDSTVMENAGKFNLYDQDRAVIYIQDNHLVTGPLKGKKVPLFDGPVSDYNFNTATQEGTFMSGSALYAFSVKKGTHQLLMDYKDITAPDGYIIQAQPYEITANAREILLSVSASGNAMSAKPGKPEKTGFDLELWTWNEPVSQRRQRRGVYNRTPMNDAKFIYHLDTKKWVEVAPEKAGLFIAPQSEHFDYAFLADPKPYAYKEDWLYNNNVDIYMVNVHTGEHKLVATDCWQHPQWSPNGKYGVFYDAVKKAWQVLDPVAAKFVDISEQIGYPVYEEEHDLPQPAPAYGIAGWTDNGNSIVIYDRYDLWAIDLTGKQKARSLTSSYGRDHEISFRLLSASYGGNLDLSRPLLLHSFNERTKSNGVYRLTPGKKIEVLIDDPAYSVQVNAISGDRSSCVFTKESYQQFPDLWWGAINFTTQKRLTDINPVQQQYKWGTARLVQWKNYEGKQNQGLLYLPADYDSTKTYPMIVDFYETHAGDLHDYITPEYSTSTINISTYVSNGYVVFRPDIHFTVGAPGESACNAVVSGTEELIKRGVADKAHIGLQGHSWSGFLVNYLVTRTNIFKCANAGAGISNMTYGYSAIKSNGAPCLFKFESEQCRIGKNLWEGKEAFLKNSPILHADKIQTPLLIFHCDKDGAVAFTQGLDMFLAMRRLQKPAWLLNYRGEGHSLDNPASQKDWTIRMGQFFDHYLKDQPMPRWMKEGISIDERNIDQKYDL